MNSTDEKIIQLEKEIEFIKSRNARVEGDKAWETSNVRKISICVLTYIFGVVFLFVIGNSSPFVNALMPVAGYFLSTLSINFIKTWWLEKFMPLK